MDRIKNIGLSEQQQKAVRSLVVQGKIQVDSFAAFNDEDLAETLVDQITAPASQGNITITPRITEQMFVSFGYFSFFFVLNFLFSLKLHFSFCARLWPSE
jgi:hypothetical protein